jgi:serine/threonine protein kinase
MSWLYEGKLIESREELGDAAVGFVYEVTHLPTGMKYIGKKILTNSYKAPPLKGLKRVRRLTKESNWKNYYGSNKVILDLLKEGATSEHFHREILKICTSKKQLTYYETYWQFKRQVLHSPDYLNENILGKFFRKDV